MGISSEDPVIIRKAEKVDDLTEITVNCPDKTGLGCDVCRVILLFGLSISKGDIATDGQWCYLVFWVVGKLNTRWDLLKNRLLEVCPSHFSTSSINCYWLENEAMPKPHDVFLLKFWCSQDRKGLLHDVTEVLCELELTIKRVKVSTTPDGRVMDLFFVTDTRELLHTSRRQAETIHHLEAMLGETLISCVIESVGLEITACSQESSFLSPAIIEDMFCLELPTGQPSGFLASTPLSITVDNFPPSHTLIQILCQDHKGLLYDIMRTLKDYNIQVSHGRFFANQKGNCEVNLFTMQADGKKIIDANKQDAVCSRLRMELLRPLRVAVVSRGPDTELLVSNPVELSGRGRPLVFHDITLALKILNVCIFSVEISRHVIHDREWEVYRILLDEIDSNIVPRNKIQDHVRKILMGWE